jgi:hypothetical protein
MSGEIIKWKVRLVGSDTPITIEAVYYRVGDYGVAYFRNPGSPYPETVACLAPGQWVTIERAES